MAINCTLRRSIVRCRQGFTLVEFLIVSAILVLLAAILLPAIQSAREAARMMDCKNNIKQLALACHCHHDVHAHFPTGGWGWYWVGDADRGFGKNQPGGWIYNLLPYFEQYSVYGQSSDGMPNTLSGTQRKGAARVIQTPLSVINCPSRRSNKLYPLIASEGEGLGYFNSIDLDRAGRSDYAMNSGHLYNEWPNRSLGQGPSDYTDAKRWNSNRLWGGDQRSIFRSVDGDLDMTGISFERSTISIKDVADGMSQTYLLGEKHVPTEHHETGQYYGDNETWCTGFNNDNYRRTGRLYGGRIAESSPIPDDSEDVPLPWGRFGSSHPSSWNVAFSDGGVRSLSYEIDWRIHRDHGNRQDGSVAISRTAHVH